MSLRRNKTVVPETENQEPVTEINDTESKPEGKEVATKTSAPAPVIGGVKSDVPSIASLENAFDPEEYGNVFPRIVGTNGAIKVSGETTSFGKFIDVQVLSTSDRWMITPDADNKDKEAKKFCRASYDGRTIPDRDGGPSITIEEYIASVDDYDFNPVSKYKDVFGIIFNADENSDIAGGKGIVQISVSPTAVKSIKAFIMQTNLYVLSGKMLATHQNCMRFRAEAKSNDSGDYTILTFEPVPLDVLSGYTPIVV